MHEYSIERGRKIEKRKINLKSTGDDDADADNECTKHDLPLFTFNQSFDKHKHHLSSVATVTEASTARTSEFNFEF